MKTYATVTLSHIGNSFVLVTTTQPKTNPDGFLSFTEKDTIKNGNNALTLFEEGEAAGYEMHSKPTMDARWMMKGKRLQSGLVAEPIRNSEGKLVDVQFRDTHPQLNRVAGLTEADKAALINEANFRA